MLQKPVETPEKKPSEQAPVASPAPKRRKPTSVYVATVRHAVQTNRSALSYLDGGMQSGFPIEDDETGKLTTVAGALQAAVSGLDKATVEDRTKHPALFAPGFQSKLQELAGFYGIAEYAIKMSVELNAELNADLKAALEAELRAELEDADAAPALTPAPKP